METTCQETPAAASFNQQVAEAFDEVARLLEEQGANQFRVRAYRNGAETVRALKGSVEAILHAEGTSGLIRLPAIGRSLAHAIEQFVRTGNLPLLERLRGDNAAERVFATVPDIGPGLAQSNPRAARHRNAPRTRGSGQRWPLSTSTGYGTQADSCRARVPCRPLSQAARRDAETFLRSCRSRRIRVARHRQGVPAASQGRPPAADRAAAFQSDQSSLAANPAHNSREPSLHGTLFQHAAGTRTGCHT